MQVSDLMSRPGITCHVHDNLNVPARLMWDHDCGAVAVVGDDGKLVGMITDRDVCMAAYTQDRPLGELEVNIAMARHPISARPDQDVEVVERAMAEHQVRRVPVVDDDNRPIGVLSLNDLAIEADRPDTRMTDASSRVVHTLAAVCAHRFAGGPAPRAADLPSDEIAPPGWFTSFYPYSLPDRAADHTKAGAP
ncbi:MAG TPA: CBS domain-containing protein [Kofleriaceae bacterium]